jgi:hypothetical protein
MTRKEFVKELRKKFKERLDEKTNWGRNHVLRNFDEVLFELTLDEIKD